MNRKYSNLFRIFFSFADLFVLNLINLVFLKSLSRFATDINDYTIFCIANNMVWLICSYASSMYLNNNILNFKRLFKRTLVSLLMFLGINFLFIIYTHSFYSNLFVVSSLAGFSLFLFISRVSFYGIISYLYKQEHFQKKVVFIGHNKLSHELISYFKTNQETTLINGYFDDHHSGNDLEFPLLGKVKDCIAYAQEHKITDIYSTLSPKAHPHLYKLAETAERFFIRFKFIPDLSEFVNHNCHVDFIDDTPILGVRPEPMESMPSRIKKRLFDVAFSSFIIIFVLSWLIPILAVLILLDSEGPVFFTQVRSGKKNLPFNCIKLRTLTVNNQADTLQVTRNDLRMTKVGRFLRKTNLDELPQFFNVLLGHMSIVGSRPHMLKHTEEYALMQDDYMVRHYIKPGVTGWAQVNGHRGEIKQHEQLKKRVEHDIWYMENWNIGLDLRIVYLTFVSTLKGDKNAF